MKASNVRLVKKIAHGAFGEIYEGIDEATHSRLAVKVEKGGNMFQLKHEYLIYKKLLGAHTPQVYEFGSMLLDEKRVNFMTMELLGLSLEKQFLRMKKSFSPKTVFMLGKACLTRIEALHHKHYIHRDIKPDNFVTDTSGKRIYLIDYGLSKLYRDPKTLRHIEYKTGKNLTGTARYASLNTHQGIEQARRDDLEGLGFMMVYFLKGRLPWQGLKAETKAEKYAKIREVKEQTPLFELCKGVPNEIYLFLLHIRNLGFEESPDYAYLETILEGGIRAKGLMDDGVYDWLIEDREP
ncbi:casein kinase 1 [Pancytospora philotis]|nr:casein kinase 1 [Pancytospora philotis]